MVWNGDYLDAPSPSGGVEGNLAAIRTPGRTAEAPTIDCSDRGCEANLYLTKSQRHRGAIWRRPSRYSFKAAPKPITVKGNARIAEAAKERIVCLKSTGNLMLESSL